jgi:hypothetical protein
MKVAIDQQGPSANFRESMPSQVQRSVAISKLLRKRAVARTKTIA